MEKGQCNIGPPGRQRAVRVGPSREAGGGEPGGKTYKRYLPSINRITGTVEWV